MTSFSNLPAKWRFKFGYAPVFTVSKNRWRLSEDIFMDLYFSPSPTPDSTVFSQQVFIYTCLTAGIRASSPIPTTDTTFSFVFLQNCIYLGSDYRWVGMAHLSSTTYDQRIKVLLPCVEIRDLKRYRPQFIQ